MAEYLEEAELRMEDTLDNLNSNLRAIRTGRASPAMLERVQVDYYGAPTPIMQLGQIQVVEGTQLVVRPYDRSSIKAMSQAIQKANLGLNPQAEADLIRIPVPALTEERRKQLAKEAHKYGEEAKVAVRNIRRDCNDMIKKDKEYTEDDKKDDLEQSQKLTDKYIKKIDKLVEDKEKDILKV